MWWQINSVATIPRFVSQSSKAEASGASLSGWSWVNEPVGISSDNAFTKDGLQEQINTTADASDYLWYSLRYQSLCKCTVSIIISYSVWCFSILKLSLLTFAVLKLKVTSLSCKMDLKRFSMCNHLGMPFMLSLMESLQVLQNNLCYKSIFSQMLWLSF